VCRPERELAGPRTALADRFSFKAKIFRRRKKTTLSIRPLKRIGQKSPGTKQRAHPVESGSIASQNYQCDSRLTPGSIRLYATGWVRYRLTSARAETIADSRPLLKLESMGLYLQRKMFKGHRVVEIVKVQKTILCEFHDLPIQAIVFELGVGWPTAAAGTPHR
jgi:hypothetical protein